MRKLIGVLVVCLLWAPTAHATFPGQNGKLAFESDGTIYSVNRDGSALTPLGFGFDPAWSPDGTRIAFAVSGTSSEPYRIYVMDSDGSDRQLIAEHSTPGFRLYQPGWSPDGTQIAFTQNEPNSEGFFNRIRIFNSDGSPRPPFNPATCGGIAAAPDWSPNGERIAFWNDAEFVPACAPGGAIYSARTDASGLLTLSSGGSAADRNMDPSWSPNGQKVLFRRANVGLFTVNPNGTGQTPLSGDDGVTGRARWSPDGGKIVFPRAAGSMNQVWVMDGDGSNGVPVLETTGTVRSPDWQPIPINSYPRPKGATPTQVALVPTYAQCTAPNRTHGPPLAFPSCNAPAQASDELTVGTGDSNGRPTKSYGYMRYDAILGNPATPADEADVGITVDIRDIYEQGTLTDYTGELRARTSLRITDKLNTPHPGGPGAATVSDASLGATVACVATADTTEGAHCNLLTTFDAIAPGTVTETRRSIWSLGAAQLDDGGADGDADTPADNTLFMTQGLFIP